MCCVVKMDGPELDRVVDVYGPFNSDTEAQAWIESRQETKQMSPFQLFIFPLTNPYNQGLSGTITGGVNNG